MSKYYFRFLSLIILFTNIPLYSLNAFGNALSPSIQIDESTPTIINKQKQTRQYIISGGAQRGSNLFHSFKFFNIKKNESVRFDPKVQTKNIFTRVTGNETSIISNILKINSNSDANLFLINPKGFKFIGDVQIQTKGSFLASTASSIDFRNGYRFSSTNTDKKIPLLTIKTPIGLSFDLPSERIEFRGGDSLKLTLPNLPEGETKFTSGTTIAFIGGELLIDSKPITNLAGQVELGAVAQGESVRIRNNSAPFTIDYKDTKKFGNISVQNAFISTSNSPSRFGNINVYGKNLSLNNNSSISVPNEENPNSSNIKPGIINIVTKNKIEITDDSFIASSPDAKVSANNISIKTKELSLRENAFIATAAFSEELDSAGAGNIFINASNIDMQGQFSRISTSTNGFGQAGNLNVNTKTLNIKGGAQIISNSQGNGNAGVIDIQSEDILIAGQNSSISALASSVKGDSGKVSINADQLKIFDQGTITVAANAEENPNAQAGELFINARFIVLDQQGVISASTVNRKGNIFIQNTDLLSLSNKSKITTNALASDNDAGNINITASYMLGQQDSDITSNALRGAGGRIEINKSLGIIGFRIEEGLTPQSDIDASSEEGVQGSVLINDPIMDPQKEQLELSDNVVNPNLLLKQACSSTAQKQEGQTSRLHLYPKTLPLASPSILKGQTASGLWIDQPKSELESSRHIQDLYATDYQQMNEVHSEASQWRKTSYGKIILENNRSREQWVSNTTRCNR